MIAYSFFVGHDVIRKNASNGSLNLDPRLEKLHNEVCNVVENSTTTLDQLPSSSFSSAPIARASTFSYPSQIAPPPAYTTTSTILPLHLKKAAPPLPAKPMPHSKPKKCVALFNYTSSVAGDLCLEKDQVVWVTKEMGEWVEGTLNGKKGIFPTSYVSMIS